MCIHCDLLKRYSLHLSLTSHHTPAKSPLLASYLAPRPSTTSKLSLSPDNAEYNASTWSDQGLSSYLTKDLDPIREQALAIVKYPDAVQDSGNGNGETSQTHLPNFAELAWLWLW